MAVKSGSFGFFFNVTATTEIYTLSLHDALPISSSPYEGGAVRWSTRQTHPPFGRMGHPRSHSWCGTEPAAGEGSLRCVIWSVARNLSERFLGATNAVGPRSDKESAIGGRPLTTAHPR